MKKWPGIKDMKSFRSYLEAYLNVFWLRPGTAIWRTYDAMVLKGLDWSLRPSLDLCCGDGVNSFLLCEGKFGVKFDVFLSVRNLTVKEFLCGEKDMYDLHFEPKQKIDILCKPSRKFDYGIDWKANSLQKAQKLYLYNDLICQDASKKLCLADKKINLIYTNALYWMDDTRGVLRELRRILKDGGKIIALLPSPELKRNYIYGKYLKHGLTFCKILDMGRYGCIKHTYSYEKWEDIFSDCGLKIKTCVNYLSGRFVEMSEVEIRPLSNVLSKMANSLSWKDRNESKRKWIETLMFIIMPMIEEGFLCDIKGPQTFFMFELEKK